MVDSRDVGLLLVLAGAAAALIGLGVYAGLFGWFGRLPGDVRVESDGFRLYLPIASMLLVSCVLSLVFAVLRRLL